MGLFPVLMLVILFLWQVSLTGYTYVTAGHAAREGARELAVDPSGSGSGKPYYEAAIEDIPGSWRKGAEIEVRGDVTVSVQLHVPVLIPGFHSPLTVGSTADTVLEDGSLTDRQGTTPHKGDFGENGNWN